MTWAAVAIGGAALISGAMGASASKKAASQQANAATQAAQLQGQQFQQTRSDLAPWMQSGGMALSRLNTLMGLGQPGGAGGLTAPTRQQFTTNTPAGPGGQWVNSGNGRNSSQQWVPGGGTQAGSSFDQAGFDSAMQQFNGQLAQGQSAQADPAYGSLTQPFGMGQFQQSPAYQFNLEQGMDAINKATRARRTNYAPATLQDIGKYSQGMASNEFLNAYNMYNQDQGSMYSRLMGMSQVGQNAGAQTGAFGNQSAQAQGGYMTDAGAARAAGTMGQANAWAGALQQGGNAWLQSNALRGAQQPNYVPMGQAFTPANQQQMNEMMGPWS